MSVPENLRTPLRRGFFIGCQGLKVADSCSLVAKYLRLPWTNQGPSKRDNQWRKMIQIAHLRVRVKE